MKFFTKKERAIPALGLGTYRLKGAEATAIVEAGIEAGFRHIDTAQMYENEAAVAEGIRKSGLSREEFFLTTKVWPTNLSKDYFLPSVRESLHKMQLDQVDLLLIHWPPPEGVPLAESIGELMKAQEEGLTHFIGVSNFNINLLKETLELGAEIITNQVEFHPFIDQTKLYSWMRKHDILLTAYAPIAHGEVMKNETLQEIAQKYDKNPVQVTLRWMLQLKGVMTIPMTSNPKHVASNMEVFDFELNEEEMEVIGALQAMDRRLVNPAEMAPAWD